LESRLNLIISFQTPSTTFIFRDLERFEDYLMELIYMTK